MKDLKKEIIIILHANDAYVATDFDTVSEDIMDEIKPLYELCKLQHEALKKCANEIMAPSVDLQVFAAIEAFNKLME